MNAVTTIKPHISAIVAPDEMRNLPAWLTWRLEYHEGEHKPRKIPYYTSGAKRHGAQGRPEDRQQLTTFDAARTAAARRGHDGVGFVPLAEFNICALDFDNCVTNGQVHPDLEAIVTGTYAEFSPSGNGVRAFVKGNYGNNKARGEPYGFEVFSSKGFVTVTGNRLDIVDILGNDNTIAELDGPVRDLCARRFARPAGEISVSTGEPVGLTPTQLETLMAALDPDMGHDTWLSVGMGLHHETQGEGFDYWCDWSEQGAKFPGREVLLHRWSSFGNSERSVTIRTAMKMAGMSVSSPASADEFEDLVGAPPAPDKPLRFPVISAHEFAAGAPPTWVIKGVLPEAELVVMYGASGSGKSFIALDMAAAIASGTPWRGKKTKQGRVAYIAAEGAGGFRKRLAAYAQHNAIDLSKLNIGVIHAAPNMMEKQDAVDVTKSIKAWGGADLIIVDTFAQVMPGANENAGEDVGKALTHCKRIHEATGAMILLIHHAGKDASKGARGWSGLRAAADAELEVTREGDARALKLTKSKDGEDGLLWGFALEVVQIGVDEDIEPITSCVVVEADAPAVGGVARKLGGIEKAVMAAVADLTTRGKTASVSDIVSLASEKLPKEEGKRDRRPESVKRSVKKLADDGFFILDGEFIDSNGFEIA